MRTTVKERTCTLLIVTYGGRKCTKLVLKPLAAKNGLSISVLCIALSCRLYYFSLHDDCPHFCSLYTTRSISIAALPFLINWKQWSESNILTADHDLVLENSSSAAVYTLPNTIIYLKALKYLNIRLRRDLMLYYGCKNSGLLCWKLKTLW